MKKNVGRPELPESERRVTKTITIKAEIWTAAKTAFPGKLSSMIESFLAESVKGKTGRK